nr:MAG TPA: hypothetical protein [Caudoviricetes sp.]
MPIPQKYPQSSVASVTPPPNLRNSYHFVTIS